MSVRPKSCCDVAVEGGLGLTRYEGERKGHIGLVNAIGIDAKTGERCGAADPRDEGSAVGLIYHRMRSGRELTLRLVVLLTVSGRYVLNVKSNPYAKNTLHLPFRLQEADARGVVADFRRAL